MWHGDGPLVPPSDLEFLYSPSAAQVALMCTPCRRQSPKRVNRNHMAYPKGTNPGHTIYKKKIALRDGQSWRQDLEYLRASKACVVLKRLSQWF